jgi:hypothetical protein
LCNSRNMSDFTRRSICVSDATAHAPGCRTVPLFFSDI